MNKQNKHFNKALLTIVGAFFMLVCALTVTTTASYAKGKPSFSPKSSSIAVNQTFKIKVKKLPKGAKAVFSSSKKKVASVDKKGKVTGKSYGKANITVSYKLKGSTKKIGTAKVNVKKATVPVDYNFFASGMSENLNELVGFDWNTYSFVLSTESGMWEKNPGTLWGSDSDDAKSFITYKNKKAKYVYKSSDTKKFTVKEDGTITGVYKTGNEKLNLCEVYKGKTRVVFSYKLKLADSYIDAPDEITVSEGEFVSMEKYFPVPTNFYYINSDDLDILENTFDPNHADDIPEVDEYSETVRDKDTNYIIGTTFKKEGTIYQWYYIYDYNKGKYDTTPVKKITVHVTKGPDSVTALKATSDSYAEYDITGTYDDYEDLNDLDPEDKESCYIGGQKDYYILQKPYNYYGEISVISSDESIATVSAVERGLMGKTKNGYIGKFTVDAKAAGTVTITVSTGGKTYSFEVVCYDDDDDDDDDDDYDDYDDYDYYDDDDY